MIKCCSHCGQEKPIELFCINRKRKDGHSGRCKDCDREYKTIYRAPPKQAEKLKKQGKAIRDRLKLLVFKAYCRGTPHCARCGANDIDVLCIDHIAGGGGQERSLSRRWGYSFYRWLRDNDFPSDFQVLCYNCNQKKRIVEGK